MPIEHFEAPLPLGQRPGGRALGNLDFGHALTRRPQLAFEALGFGVQAFDLHAALDVARCGFGRRRFDRAQARVDRVQLGPRMRERALGREFVLARRFDVALQRREAFDEIADRRLQRLALGAHAGGIFRGLRALRFEGFAARQRRRVIGFQTGQVRARRLGLAAQLLELKFAAIDARPRVGELGRKRRDVRGLRAARFVVLGQFRAQRFALCPPRRARANVGEDLQVAHAAADLAVPFGAPELRLQLGNAPL